MNFDSAYISIGSNLGNRAENCCNGIAAIVRSDHTKLMQQSFFYLTEPVDYQNQAWFINAVIKIDTVLNPIELLEELKSIQRQAGRTHDPIRFGPRVLDLDILLYEDRVLDLPGLKIPHSRMHKRRFVLKPICDIDPKIIHPVFKKDMQTLLDDLEGDAQQIIRYSCDC